MEGTINLIKKKFYALNLEYLGGYTAAFQTTSVAPRSALLPPILMEMESCQNCDFGLQIIKYKEASVNKSEALAGQSG